MRSASAGLVLFALAAPSAVWAADEDGDGWAVEDGDCDDADADVHPGAEEDCDRATDRDCDGNWYVETEFVGFYTYPKELVYDYIEWVSEPMDSSNFTPVPDGVFQFIEGPAEDYMIALVRGCELDISWEADLTTDGTGVPADWASAAYGTEHEGITSSAMSYRTFVQSGSYPEVGRLVLADPPHTPDTEVPFSFEIASVSPSIGTMPYTVWVGDDFEWKAPAVTEEGVIEEPILEVVDGPNGLETDGLVLRWTPTAEQVGDWTLTLRVVDDDGDTADLAIAVTVVPRECGCRTVSRVWHTFPLAPLALGLVGMRRRRHAYQPE